VISEEDQTQMPENEDLPQVQPPEMPEGDPRRQPGYLPPDGAGFDMGGSDENPIWVTATVEFEGDVWEHVGIRFKGNSSLRSAWSSGSYKIPFKLDFDQFEEDYPETEDQRFYGFKQLSLANNFSDDSFLREKITADMFRDFGIPSAHTAFYEVYVDYGEGLEYFGLYTMVEMVEDTVIEEQFSDDSGNLYKPEGAGATFAEGTFSELSFDKETNQDEGDYNDIQGLFDAIHADNRFTDPEAWRQQLESVFDVDTFLRWLAANTTIQNWDTYGVTNHNYYLYTDPGSGLVSWIPWDNNMALSGPGMRRIGETLSLSLEEVGDRYPLIRYLMDDPVYQARYESYLAEFIETTFIPEEWEQKFRYYHDLISDSVLKERAEATTLSSISAFQNSVESLNEHIKNRYQAVEDYLTK
jgi:spore coat protein CotH